MNSCILISNWVQINSDYNNIILTVIRREILRNKSIMERKKCKQRIWTRKYVSNEPGVVRRRKEEMATLPDNILMTTFGISGRTTNSDYKKLQEPCNIMGWFRLSIVKIYYKIWAYCMKIRRIIVSQ